MIAGRYYLQSKSLSRFYGSMIIGLIGVTTSLGTIQMPMFGLSLGYDWRISKKLRLSIEGGLGLVTILIFSIPMPLFGLSLGLVF